ncbi:HD domain-containing phosphohydrolase [Pseudoalteromonas sp. S2755]|uniref:HD domain-containing phosphohydrolase n=1 Tax=Pseudoalteromonas sp. S2755 TaxID=2066523 RepID=UPI00110BC8E1|nr:HD domain-containing phosphohydrolase [Pseudoalteromonas sp. S2755]TMN36619.1 two-component system response regulator [Pseudoalteromonas sp. S2755]
MSQITKPSILLIDDDANNIAYLVAILSKLYELSIAKSGKTGLKLATKHPDLILLDVVMPELSGYETMKLLRANPATCNIPVIFLTSLKESKEELSGLALGAVDYLNKPINESILKARVATHLALSNQKKHLETLVSQRTEELADSRLDIIRMLGKAAEYKDNETGFHVIRMSAYAAAIAKKLGMDESWCSILLNAAPMHDIGKIGIPDQILQKPAKLSPVEWETMKLHATYGAEIIGDTEDPLLYMAKEVALCHHEKWDGSGYPNHLQKYEIPLSARIVAVADVYDALTSVRPYKKAWDVDKAIGFINSQSGIHFDPEVVAAFNLCINEITLVQKKFQG